MGETGGKDFVRGASQRRSRRACGPRWSAARSSTPGRSARPRRGPTSPAVVWNRIADDLVAQTEALAVGDVRDLANFTSAVIDQRRSPSTATRSSGPGQSGDAEIIAGGETDDSVGWFVRPTLIASDNPRNEIFTTEYFGPILGVYVYDDADFAPMLAEVDQAAPYGLTGAVLADDRAALAQAAERAAARGRQLLPQRQADRRRRRPAAVRRVPGLRHQRQGRLDVEPDPLDQPPFDQGDPGAATEHGYPHMG